MPKGLSFPCSHGGLHVEPYLSGKPLVTNNPRGMFGINYLFIFFSKSFFFFFTKGHPKSVAEKYVPDAHPPMNSLFGMPIFSAGQCVGVMEVANRKGGYNEDMIEAFRQVTDSIGVLLHLFSNASGAAPAEPELNFNSAELSSAVIQSVSDAIIVTDAQLSVQLVNNGGLRLFGFDRSDQVRGQKFPDMITTKFDWQQLVKVALEGGESLPCDSAGAVRDVNGKEVPVSISVSLFLFNCRRYICFILMDQRTKRSYEEKMRFMAFLSHELRTPLQVIVCGLQDMLDSDGSPVEESQLRLLIDSSNMITRVVNSVLDLSRLESGAVQKLESPCVVKEVIEGIFAMLRPYRRNPAVELRASYDVGVPATILMDRVRCF